MDLCFRKGYHSPTTFYKCIANEDVINPQWKHPKHSEKWNDALIDDACKYISDHQTATLDEIIIKMIEEYGAPEISKSTLIKYLCFSLITLKKVEYHPIARNSPQTKQQRIEYGEFFIQNSDKHLIFIDEVGYTIAIQRNKGRSPKGQPVIEKLPLHRTANTTVCMAIDDTEILHFEKRESSFNGDSFSNFLKDLIEIIESKQITNACLIFENSPVHKDADIKKVCRGKVEYRFLPHIPLISIQLRTFLVY